MLFSVSWLTQSWCSDPTGSRLPADRMCLTLDAQFTTRRCAFNRQPTAIISCARSWSLTGGRLPVQYAAVTYSGFYEWSEYVHVCRPVMPAPAHTADAKCSQCGEIFKLTLTGLLHKHGHGHGRQACAGSGKPPDPSCSPSHQKPVDLLNAGFATSPDSASLREQPFSFDSPPAGLLKRIPRAARLRASTAFEKCIAELTADPSDRLIGKSFWSSPAVLPNPPGQESITT